MMVTIDAGNGVEMRGWVDAALRPGHRVRVQHGPYEREEGEVVRVVGWIRRKTVVKLDHIGDPIEFERSDLARTDIRPEELS